MKFKKSLSGTFHVQRSSCVIGCFGDNNYQLIMRQYFVKFIYYFILCHDKSIFFLYFPYLKFDMKF